MLIVSAARKSAIAFVRVLDDSNRLDPPEMSLWEVPERDCATRPMTRRRHDSRSYDGTWNYGLPTKRAAVDLALRKLDLEPLSRDEALAMRGTGWESDLGELRSEYLDDRS